MQHADQVAYLERMLNMVRTNTRDDGPGLSHTAVEGYFDPAQYQREVAQLFRKLAAIEGLHAKQILDEMGWPQMPEPVYALQWAGGEPPESAPVTELHYLMQPWHALELALNNEKRAEKFLAGIAKSPRTPAEGRKLEAEMAAEETEHVRLIRAWMKRVPKPDRDWSRDPDPPHLGD